MSSIIKFKLNERWREKQINNRPGYQRRRSQGRSAYWTKTTAIDNNKRINHVKTFQTFCAHSHAHIRQRCCKRLAKNSKLCWRHGNNTATRRRIGRRSAASCQPRAVDCRSRPAGGSSCLIIYCTYIYVYTCACVGALSARLMRMNQFNCKLKLKSAVAVKYYIRH